jgi:hypothetical protein
MMKRGFAAKAAALLMAAGTVTAGGALFAAPAWANLSDITIACQAVSFHYTLFSSSGATATEQVSINGSLFASKQFTFSTTEAFDTIAIPGVTGDVVTASTSWVDVSEGPGSAGPMTQTLTGCQAAPTTTTTVPATTTTVPATTTTVPATTTIPTTVPATTTIPATTTTTQPPVVGTAPLEATTTLPPVVGTAPLEATTTAEPTVTTSPESALAFTGANTGLDLGAGGTLIALGAAAVVVARRRRRQ